MNSSGSLGFRRVLPGSRRVPLGFGLLEFSFVFNKFWGSYGKNSFCWGFQPSGRGLNTEFTASYQDHFTVEFERDLIRIIRRNFTGLGRTDTASVSRRALHCVAQTSQFWPKIWEGATIRRTQRKTYQCRGLKRKSCDGSIPVRRPGLRPPHHAQTTRWQVFPSIRFSRGEKRQGSHFSKAIAFSN